MAHKYIHRDLELTLIKLVKQFPAVVVTGPRQSGKSTLLKEMFSGSHAYVSFDDPIERERAISDPKLFLHSLGDNIILDEIQYVPQILSYLKIMIDEERSKRGRFIITGSQQFNLIKNLGDSLAGRIAIIELLPFDTSEKDKARKSRNKLLQPQNYFMDACLRGSFPEIVTYPEIDSEAWYGSYMQTYLERDVRTLHNIGNLRDFQRLMQLLAARCSQILNLNALSIDLGVAVNTIKNWLSVLEASRLIYLLMPYYQNLGKRLTKSPKLYFLDCGLLCHLLSLKDKQYLLNGPMAGAIFENFCMQETIKQFLNNGKRPRLYYARTPAGLEVDLLIELEGKLYPVEFKLSKTPNISMAEPIHRFTRIFSKLPILSGKIVSLSPSKGALSKTVSLLPFNNYLKWLSDSF